jgi:hypothetical protein
MSKTLKIIGEYAVLKVKDAAGSDVVMGYYKHAVVPNVDDACAEHNISIGLAEDFAAADEQEPAQDSAPVFDKPHGNAGRDAWATYALESGQASEDEVKDLSRDELRELYG